MPRLRSYKDNDIEWYLTWKYFSFKVREIEDELNKKKRGIKHTKKVRVLKEFDSP